MAMPKSPRVGVIDIGSNSVRLVVYDRLSRAPAVVVNEKVSCALGRAMDERRLLNPDGVREALACLARFAQMAEGLRVSRLDVLATAALRVASDAGEFIAEVKKHTGLKVRVLSGEEEARLGALGILSGFPEAAGVAGDLGGGSLELIEISPEEARRAPMPKTTPGQARAASLPLGPFALLEATGGKMKATEARIAEILAKVPWLAGALRKKDFYLIGGGWRTLAKLYMQQKDYPLQVVQHFTVDSADFLPFAEWAGKQEARFYEKLGKAFKKRADSLPLASLVLAQILRQGKPARLVFSAFGLRDGHVFQLLPAGEQIKDPLLSWAETYGTARLSAEEHQPLVAWTAPLFQKEEPAQARLRQAACLFSDLGWADHPDYRAEHSFATLLSLPAGGIDHAGRAYLALAVYGRYGGKMDGEGASRLTAPARALLPKEQAMDATALGLALRLAFTLTGGALPLLARTRLFWGGAALILDVSAELASLLQDDVRKALSSLANHYGKDFRLTVAGKGFSG